VIEELRGIVGAAHVLTGADAVARYVRDWTGRFTGATPAVVRPADTAEVAAVLALCARDGTPVVPQGGNTGLVGGSVPLHGEVVLSLERLRAVGPVDPAAAQLTAGAGATLADVQAAAAGAGLLYPVDLSARGSATVGGMVATNAGGLHVVRYGDTRGRLAGYEAVLADGTVLRHLAGLEKDNTGYDLGALLCGSEGTLGVVTAARLRLVARPRHRVTALLAFSSVAAAAGAVAELRQVESLTAAELMVREGVALVRDRFGVAPPFAELHPAYLLVEAAAGHDPVDELAAAADRAEPDDVAVADSPDARAALWEVRERHTEAVNLLGPPVKLDVTLPHARLAAFLEAVGTTVEASCPGARTWLFGHAADGNVHVNVTGCAPAGDDAVTAAVLELVAEQGGSISAEHGIGTVKRAYLHLVRTPAEIATFRRLKSALDPQAILNPHVLLP
jgi:FAD/FMN-containing dehydrogenase